MKDVLKRLKPNFVVKYRFLEEKENLPYPGSMVNFMFNENESVMNIISDIFPEFKKSELGDNLIPNHKRVNKEGIADMWVISRKFISKHSEKLYVGKKCFFLNGHEIIAECEIVGVNQNLISA